MFAQVKGQEESRRAEHFIDQHGREYVANVEKETGDPCDVLVPLYTAPLGPDWFAGQLIPPAKYRQMVPHHLRARKRYQVEINYVQWLQDLDDRQHDFEQKLHDFARGAAKGGADIQKIVSDPPPVIRDLIGAPPFPPIILVEAMRAGNQWALGQSSIIPKKVLDLLSELKPLVQRSKKSRDVVAEDPFADDDADEFMGDMVDTVRDPLGDDLNDLEALEEQFDPNATGGKREKVGAGRSKRGREQ